MDADNLGAVINYDIVLGMSLAFLYTYLYFTLSGFRKY